MAPVKATLKEEKSSDKKQDNHYTNDNAYEATTDPATDEAQDNTDSTASTNPGPRQITMLRMSAPTSARAQAILSSQPSKPNPRKRLAAVVSHPFQLSGSAKTGREPTLKRKKSSGDEDDKKEEATNEDSEPSSSNDGSARKKKKVE